MSLSNFHFGSYAPTSGVARRRGLSCWQLSGEYLPIKTLINLTMKNALIGFGIIDKGRHRVLKCSMFLSEARKSVFAYITELNS